MSSDSSTTSDLIASVVASQKRNGSSGGGAGSGGGSASSEKNNNNNLKISAETQKATKPKASAPPPPPAKSTTSSSSGRANQSAAKSTSSVKNGTTNNNNLLMSTDIVNLANVLSAQTTSIGSDAQAKQVLKEAVDAVVNSFAKHTQGYGRGTLRLISLLISFSGSVFPRAIAFVRTSQREKQKLFGFSLFCDSRSYQSWTSIHLSANRAAQSGQSSYEKCNKEMSAINAITDIANFPSSSACAIFVHRQRSTNDFCPPGCWCVCFCASCSAVMDVCLAQRALPTKSDARSERARQ